MKVKKILVGLRVPSIQARYDLFIPIDMEISTLIGLLSDGVRELSEGHYRPCTPNLLVEETAGVLLDPAKTLEDYGAEDGARLLLF